MLQLMMPVRWK